MTEIDKFDIDDSNLPPAGEAALDNDFSREVKKAIDTHKTTNLCKRRNLADMKKIYHYAVLRYQQELHERGTVVRKAQDAREWKINRPPAEHVKPKLETELVSASREDIMLWLEELVREVDVVSADAQSIRDELSKREERREERERERRAKKKKWA